MRVDEAEVGTCFYEHFQPPKYLNVASKILAAEASERMIVTLAQYETVTKKIVTDSTRVKLLPSVAVYKLDLNGKKQFVETEDVISQKLFVWSKFLL